jgi:hypothetical protein
LNGLVKSATSFAMNRHVKVRRYIIWLVDS